MIPPAAPPVPVDGMHPHLSAALRAAGAAALVTAAAGLEVGVDQPGAWADPDASHHGRHAAGGAAIGALVYTAAPLTTRRRRYAAAIAAAAVAGIGWEVARAGHGAIADPVDAAWTVAGAAVGAAAADLAGCAFTITPRRDGAALGLAWRF